MMDRDLPLAFLQCFLWDRQEKPKTVPSPSRRTRDGEASTKPSFYRAVVEAARFLGGKFFSPVEDQIESLSIATKICVPKVCVLRFGAIEGEKKQQERIDEKDSGYSCLCRDDDVRRDRWRADGAAGANV
jgi:hypothetical protein